MPAVNERTVNEDSQRFKWTKAMSVGVAALDADHQCLVRIINLLHEVRDDEEAANIVPYVLDTLMVYGRRHFAREEKVMEACAFPGFAFHRGEHKGFGSYIGALREGPEQDHARIETAITLYGYLTSWLVHHIQIQDMAYKPYVMTLDDADEIARAVAPPIGDICEAPATH